MRKSKLPAERQLSFKYLRKTIADQVLRFSDEATQQQMLAHAHKTVAARHYTGRPEFARLGAVLRRVREEVLAQMFALPPRVD
jgi:hypothetical protein